MFDCGLFIEKVHSALIGLANANCRQFCAHFDDVRKVENSQGPRRKNRHPLTHTHPRDLINSLRAVFNIEIFMGDGSICDDEARCSQPFPRNPVIYLEILY